MCSPSGIVFGVTSLPAAEVANKRVLEVGALNVNGGLRDILSTFGPSEYLGVDIGPGPGVDEVCDVSELVARFGEESFEIVVSTELLEHVEQWRKAVSNLKRVLRQGGTLLITTRSPGFKYHGYPNDFWRYRIEDMERIFEDFEILSLTPDPEAPGVFLKARKPTDFRETNLEEIELYSVITGRREVALDRRLCERVRRRHLWQARVRRILIRCVDAAVGKGSA